MRRTSQPVGSRAGRVLHACYIRAENEFARLRGPGRITAKAHDGRGHGYSVRWRNSHIKKLDAPKTDARKTDSK